MMYRENKILKIEIKNRTNKPTCKWNHAKCATGDSSSITTSNTKKPSLITVLINVPKKNCIDHKLLTCKSISKQKLGIAMGVKEFCYLEDQKKKIRRGVERDSWKWNTQIGSNFYDQKKKQKREEGEEKLFYLGLEMMFWKMKEVSIIETREWISTWMSLQIRYILFKIQIAHK